MTEFNEHGKDHDLLIEISVNVKNLVLWMEGNEKRLEKHEAEDKQEFAEHSKQLRDLSRGYWIAIGAIFIIEFMLRFVK